MLGFDLDIFKRCIGNCGYGQNTVVHNECPSSQDIASSLASEGCANGTTILALYQSAGRGRQGRYFSVVVDTTAPSENMVEQASSFTSLNFTAPVVVALALKAIMDPQVKFAQRQSYSSDEIENLSEALATVMIPLMNSNNSVVSKDNLIAIKWPNDVQLCGKKVSGMILDLVPTFSGSGGDIQQNMRGILGIGINLNIDPSSLYPALKGVAGSVVSILNNTKQPAVTTSTADDIVSTVIYMEPVLALIFKLLERLTVFGDDPSPPVMSIYRYFGLLNEGSVISVHRKDGLVRAKVVRLLPDHTLLIRVLDTGIEEVLSSAHDRISVV